MCHGAGGLAAHHRFGARTGMAPAMFGALLLALGLILADQAASLLAVGAARGGGRAALVFGRRPGLPGACSMPDRHAGR
jgi:hypothetical protein